MTRYDCVIIGAGLSGLAAGVRLAHFGRKVRILERHSRLGGLNSYYSRGGHEFETGLHAVTNFAPKDAPRSATLLRLLRQLRLDYDELELREQKFSLVKFPSATLRFGNDFAEFKECVSTLFPAEADAFAKFDRMMSDYDELDLLNKYHSARAVLARYFKSPLLVGMLMCPAMFYGSPEPEDMDFNLFAILYKSIFKQGFCRPAGDGIRGLLEMLRKRYTESGGELTLNCGVASMHEENGRASRLVTDKGEEIFFDNILSSAGLRETMSLLDGGEPAPEPGKMTFAESIAVVDGSFDDNSGGAAIIFYSDKDDFEHKIPSSAVDCSSGIICMPSNFKFRPGDRVPEKSVRVSAKASADIWLNASEDEYKKMKDSASKEMFSAARKVLGCADMASAAVAVDVMTPRTIKRFTGHCNGAIYGSPLKLRDGRTRLSNLYVCGTDQGFLGITGAMFSGITVANLYLLK